MSAYNKQYLKDRYRDQLVRELQALRVKHEIKFPKDVVDLMTTVAKEKARIRETKHYWWRRFLPAVYVRRDDTLLASDLYLLEATLIEHLEIGDLKIRVAGFREMLSHLLTEESYLAMSNCFSKNLAADGITTEDLVPEARALISRIYRRYEGVPAVEDLRLGTAVRIMAVAALVSLAIAKLTQIDEAPPALVMGACGAIGAAMSTLERLFRFDPRHEPFKTFLSIKSNTPALMLSPIIGCAFALVLSILIQAHLLGGLLFPDVTDVKTFNLFQLGWSDAPTADLAKLYGWGFIAGWAERMVPDVLDKLAPQVASNVKIK